MVEYMRILIDLLSSEQPQLLGRAKDAAAWATFFSDPGSAACAEAASAKAAQVLKDRKQHDHPEKPGSASGTSPSGIP
jgi:hypothetical protein